MIDDDSTTECPVKKCGNEYMTVRPYSSVSNSRQKELIDEVEMKVSKYGLDNQASEMNDEVELSTSKSDSANN